MFLSLAHDWKMLNNKSQIAAEFVLLIFVAFCLLIVFILFTRVRAYDLKDERIYSGMKDIAYSVQTELLTAAEVSDGYRRYFDLPDYIENEDYNVTFQNGYVIISRYDHEVILNVPHVTGSIQRGNNTISKEGGVIYVN